MEERTGGNRELMMKVAVVIVAMVVEMMVGVVVVEMVEGP